jgi:3D (Asp-Asp-Asp) domain-containing protein
VPRSSATSSGRRLGLTFSALAVAAAAATLSLGGDASAKPGDATLAEATALSATLGKLSASEQAAVLRLFSARSMAITATARAAALSAQRDEAQRQVAANESLLAAKKRTQSTLLDRLTRRLVEQYRADTVDPLVVLLQEGSLEKALDTAALNRRVNATDASIVSNLKRTKRDLAAEGDRLTAARDRFASAVTDARAQAAVEQLRASEETSLISSLRSQEHLTTDRIAQLRADAAVAAQNAEAAAAAAAAGSGGSGAGTSGSSGGSGASSGGGATAGSDPGGGSSSSSSGGSSGGATSTTSSGTEGPPASGRSETFEATSYSLTGTTATGIPTRLGVCATDPSVIPLGTRFRVSGYGDCIAADTGSAIQGHIIDVWLPTEAQSEQWGRRQVTVTFY